MKKKIIFLSSGLSNEGIGIFLKNVFTAIDKSKFDITFCFATKYKQEHEQFVLNNGAKVLRTYEIGDRFGIIKHSANLHDILKEGKYDIVHSHMDFMNGFNMVVAKLAGVPLRISHGHINIEPAISLKKRFYQAVMRQLNKSFANVHLGCSGSATKHVNAVGQVINNGIDLNKFKNNKIFNKSSGIYNLVTVGRIDYQKNPLFIVKILSALKNKGVAFSFDWIGTGSLENEVKELVHQLDLEDNIKFLGSRNDVNEILKTKDLFLFPSLYEGLGIVLVEAQAAGLPCLISDVIPKEVDCGLTRRLSLADSPEVWAENIIDMLAGKDPSLSLNQDQLVKFDIKNTVRDLENIYAN